MLVKMSCITVGSSSAHSELAYICHLTGRLPLCIAIVAGMASRFVNWQGELLELLKEDAIGALNEESDGKLGPSELVVARSVNELPSEDAKELFTWLSLLPEDTPCPIQVSTKQGFIVVI